jgi:hypothetical protein
LLLELTGKSEWGTESPKHFQFYLTPGIRKATTLSGNLAVDVGVQLPVSPVKEVNYRVMGYILYELPPLQFEE